MSLVVVGSMALDSIETPAGVRERCLGGSATYFSAAASHFAEVALVAVVGNDFPAEGVDFLKHRGVDLTGLTRTDGETFHWKGRYGATFGDAETLDTQLGVFAEFEPELPESYRKAKLLFLANIDPTLQGQVADQVHDAHLVALDTMNFWIEGKLEELKRTLAKVGLLIINETEARQLAGEHNIVQAARVIRGMGPERVIIKRGEYGAMLFDGEEVFVSPAYPTTGVVDPTGAGDSFAGGFMGFLGHVGRVDRTSLRQAMVTGTVMASFAVEGFSLERVMKLETDEIRARIESFRHLTHFETVELEAPRPIRAL